MSYLPNFPNVPNTPGVPPVLRNLGEIQNSVEVLLSGDILGTSTFSSQRGQWGIFDQKGNLVLTPNSFKELDYRHAWRIANYPMEQGAFQSYNKVQTPFENNLTVVIGGSVQELNDFLTTLEAIADSLNLYNIVSPEYTYTNVSIEGINYRRHSVDGVTMLTIDIRVIEIRLTTFNVHSDTALPGLSAPVNGGTVQAYTASQQQALANIKIQ